MRKSAFSVLRVSIGGPRTIKKIGQTENRLQILTLRAKMTKSLLCSI